MIVKLLTEHRLEFLSLKGGCRGSSMSTNVKMPHCWKSHWLILFIFSWDMIFTLQLLTQLLSCLTEKNIDERDNLLPWFLFILVMT